MEKASGVNAAVRWQRGQLMRAHRCGRNQEFGIPEDLSEA